MEQLTNDLTPPGQIDHQLPGFIAVEGPIGVGKTTLAKRLANSFNYDTLLEQPEQNPFLERFYEDRRSGALPAQLFFLFQRARQIQEMRQGDIFQQVRVADFLIDKDQLFAQITLDDDELKLYQTVYQQLTIDAPRPDLVIYLQAPTDVLLDRVQRRGTEAEKAIDATYLHQLNDAYTRFFYYYDDAPLLIVNAADIDLANSEQDYHNLLAYLLNIKTGRHYYNPQAHL
ncbi:deoxynucleoside kinase [Porticoccus sp.]|uniref:deoxynucleoside kinase n=1 Tax=Porticoccus sp. TaxID=2024853 RepID=UPI003F6A1397